MQRKDWTEYAAELEVGKSVRVSHTCSDDRSMIVSRDSNGASAYCHRCGKVGWLPPPPESMEQKLERIARFKAGDSLLPADPFTLPSPREYDTYNWPIEARVWLYKAGLDDFTIRGLGIYWHRESDRVIVPVNPRPDGTADYYQARAYQPGRQPKYLGPTPRPPKLISKWGAAKEVCLTEDLLSAIKIGTIGGEGWCLLGTRITAHQSAVLLSRGCIVRVCLDPDGAGRKGAGRIMVQLRAYGIEAIDVVFPKDPKLIHVGELRSVLCIQD